MLGASGTVGCLGCPKTHTAHHSCLSALCWNSPQELHIQQNKDLKASGHIYHRIITAFEFWISTLKTSLCSPYGYTENPEDWMCSQDMCYHCRDPQAVGLRAPSHLGSPRQLFWGTWPTLRQDPPQWRKRPCWTLWTDTSWVPEQL